MRKTYIKYPVLFASGGGLYAGIEILWRGYTHWTMAVLGGALFILLGGINEWIPWDMPMPIQVLTGTACVTLVELAAGMILNVWLGLHIWDYSNMPLNLFGQICLPYCAAWAGLSLIAIVLDDYLRHWLWGEEKPHYRLV